MAVGNNTRTRISGRGTRRVICLAVAAAVGSLMAGTLGQHAYGDDTWSGLGDGTTWENPQNWVSSTPPGNTSTPTADLATFNTAGTYLVTLTSGSRYLGGMAFDTNAGTYTIGTTAGSSFLLNDGGSISILSTFTGPSAIQTINAPLQLLGNYTFANYATDPNSTLQIGGTVSGSAGSGSTATLYLAGTNTGTNLISGVISDGTGGGTLQIVKNDTGYWTLSGNNTFSGGVQLNNGRLILNNSGSLGTGTLTIGNLSTPTNTVTLSNTSAGLVTINGNSQIWNTTFHFAPGATPEPLNMGTGNVYLAGALEVWGDSSQLFTVGGVISGLNPSASLNAFDVISGGGGSVLFNNPAPITIRTGGQTFNANNLGYAFFTIASPVILGPLGDQVLTVNGAHNGSLTGSISGATGSIVINTTTGALALSGNNTFGGGVNLQNGILYINGSGSLGTGTLTIGANTTISCFGAAIVVATGNSQIWNGNFSFGVGSNPVTALNLGTGSVSLGATAIQVTNNLGALLTVGGVVTGTSTLTLYAGSTGGLTFSGLVNNSGSIYNSGTGNGLTTLSGGVGSFVTAITENSTGSNLTVGAINVASGSTTLTNANAAGAALFTINGGVIGTGDLYLNNNSGINNGLTLSTAPVNNSGSIYASGTGTGSILISGGVGANVSQLVLSSNTVPVTVSGNVTVSSFGANVVNNSGALLTLSGGVSGTGVLTHLGTGTGNTTISGIIAGGVTGVVQNSPTSTLILSGANTSFTGGLTILSGTANLITNAAAAGTGTITLGATAGAANATLGIGITNVATPIVVAAGSSGTLTIQANASITLTSPITLNNNAVVQTSGVYTLALPAAFSGTGQLYVGSTASNGTYTFSNSNSTFAGGITVIGGTYNIGTNNTTNPGDKVLGTGIFTIGTVGGTGTIAFSATNTYANISSISGSVWNQSWSYGGNGSGCTFIFANTVPITVGANITVSNVSITGMNINGTVNLGGYTLGLAHINNAQNSAITFGGLVSNGSIVVSGSGSGASTTFNGGLNNITAITQTSTTGTLTVQTLPITVGAGGTTLTNNSTAAAFNVTSGIIGTGNLTLNYNGLTNGGITVSTTAVNNAGTITNSGTGSGYALISANLGPNITGIIQNSTTSALTLSGTNTANGIGPTTITNGTMNLSSSGAIQFSTVVMNGGNLGSLTFSTATAFTLGGLSATASGAGFNIALMNTTPAAIALSVGANNGNASYAGILSGSGSLIKIGTGTQTLSAANTYYGGTTVSVGTLQLNISTATPNVLCSTASATLGGGTLAVQNTSGAATQTISSLVLTANTSNTIRLATASSATGVSLTAGGTFTNPLITSGTTLFLDLTNAGTGALTLGATTTATAAFWAVVTDNTGTTGFGKITSTSSGQLVRDATFVSLTGTASGAATDYWNTNPSTDTGPNQYNASNILTLSATTHALNSLFINAAATGSLDLAGQALSLTNNALAMAGANNFTITDSLGTGTLSAATTATLLTINQVGTGTLTINARINTGGAGGLTKGGSGTLVLGANNTYTGPTTVAGGTLILSGANTGAGVTTVTAGSTLDLQNQLAVQNSTVTLAPGYLVFDSSVTSNAFTLGGLAAASYGPGYDLALQNNATSSAAITLTVGGNNATTTYAGTLSGGGSLIKTGTGNLTLSGNNTFTGGVTILNGLIYALTNTAFGTGPITLGSATGNAAIGTGNNSLTLTIANPITVVAAASIDPSGAGPGNTTLSGLITLNANLTVGNGANRAPTITGGTVGSGGDLIINELGTAVGVTISGALLNHVGQIINTGVGAGNTTTISAPIGPNVTNILQSAVSGGLTLSGSSVANSGNITFSGTGTSIVTFSSTSIAPTGTITNNGLTTGVTTISGNIVSAAGVIQNSATSKMILSGSNNTFTGGTTVSAGRLQVSGAGTLLGTSGLSVAAGARFDYLPTVASTQLNLGSAGTLTLADGSSIGMTFGATINAPGGATVTGNVSLIPSGAFVSGTTYTLLTAASGNLYPANYVVLNATGYTFGGVTVTPMYVSIQPITATPLTTSYWTGGLTSNVGVWAASTGPASNWTSDGLGTPTGQVPGATTNVIFSDLTSASNQNAMTLGADMAINTLTVTSTSSVTLNTNGIDTLTIMNGITLNANAGTTTLNTPLVLGATQTWNNNSGNTLVVNGLISGAFGIVKTGTGAVTLATANTFTGGVTFVAGTVNVNNAAALGTGVLTMNGGTLDNTSGAAITNTNNNAQTWNANFTFNGSNPLNLGTGAVTLTTIPTVTNNGSGANSLLTVGGAMTSGTLNAYDVILAGTGQLTLSSGTAITLRAGGQTLTSNGGLLSIGTPATISGFLTVTGTGNAALTGILSGTGSGIIKNGTGFLTLSGANTFTGGLSVKSGTVTGTVAAAFGAGTITLGDTTGNANVTLIGGFAGTHTNTISVASGNTGTATITSTAAAIFSGPVTLNSHNLYIAPAATNITLSGLMTGTGSLYLNAGGLGTITLGAAAINNSGSIYNSGTGSALTTISGPLGTNVQQVVQNSTTSALTLATYNTFAGGVIIKAGTVTGSTNTSAFGSGAIVLGDTGTNAPVTLVGNLAGTFANTINVTANTSTATITSLANAVFSGAVNLYAHDLYLSPAASNLTLSGLMGGTGNLYLTAGGAGIVSVTGTINSVGTIYNSGTGSATNLISGAIGSNITAITQNSTTSALTVSGTINVAGGGTTVTNNTLKLVTLGSVVGTGNLILNTNGNVASGITDSGVVNNSGNIYNSGTGTNSTLLSGGVGANVQQIFQNSNTSPLSISGSLTVNNLMGTTVINNSGILFTLSGSTSGTGALTLQDNGTGSFSVATGALAQNGSLTLQANNTGTISVSSAINCTGSLYLYANSTGLITLSGAVNATGSIYNNGTGSGVTNISGVIGAGIAAVNQNSTTSALSIAGNNAAYTSGFYVGTATQLNINGTGSLGTGTLSLATGAILDATAGAITDARTNNQYWAGNFTFLGSNALNLGPGAAILASAPTVTVNANTLTVGGTIGDITGAVYNAFDITKAGNGTLSLTSTTAITVRGGGQTVSDLAGSLTVSSPIILGAQNLNVASSAYTTLTGSISGAGGTLLKTGLGTLTLNNAANNFGGGTLIQQGVVTAANASFGSGPITITPTNATAGLVTTATVTVPNAIGVTSGDTNSAFISDRGGTLTLSGPVTFSQNVTLYTSGGNIWLAGGMTTSTSCSTITIHGNGTGLDFRNPNNNFQGPVNFVVGDNTDAGAFLEIDQVAGGYLSPNVIVTLNGGPSGSVFYAGNWNSYASIGGLQDNTTSAGAGNVAGASTAVGLNNSLTITVASGSTYTYSGTITGGDTSGGIRALVLSGPGTQILTGANSFQANVAVNNGTLRITSTNALSYGSAYYAGQNVTVQPIVPGSPAILDLYGVNPVNKALVLNGGTGQAYLINSNPSTPSLIDSGVVQVNLTYLSSNGWGITTSNIAAGVTIGAPGGAAGRVTSYSLSTNSLMLGGGANYLPGDTINITGGGGSSASITVDTVDGNGGILTWHLNNDGSGFTGLPTGISGGTATVHAFTAATAQFLDGGFGIAAVNMTAPGSGYVTLPTFTQSAGSGVTFNPLTGGYPNQPSTLSSVTLSSAASTNFMGGDGNLTINAVVGSTGGFTKIGLGTLVLAGANTYTGGTNVNAGTLQIANALALGTKPVAVNSISNALAQVQLQPGLFTATPYTFASASMVTFTGGTMSQMDVTNNYVVITGAASSLSSYAPHIVTSLTTDTQGQFYGAAVVTGQEFINGNGGVAVPFAGHTPVTTDLLATRALIGDTNLDGQITIDDYLAIDAGYRFGATDWAEGDFLGNGQVTPLDYAEMDYNYAIENPAAGAGMELLHTQEFGSTYVSALDALSAPVPEPTSLALLGLGAAALLRRKRRR